MSKTVFTPTKDRKESILVFANEKVGKTTAWLEIADKTDNSFFVFDSDDTLIPSLEDFPTLESQRDRFTQFRPFDWEDYKRMANDAVIKAQEGDWIIVDRVDPMREACRDYFIEQIYGQGTASWIVETLREKKEKGLKGSEHTEIPWSQINAQYYSLVNFLHRRSKAHVFWATNAKQLIRDGMMADKAKIISLYDDVDHKPGGGNDFGYIPHSILYMNKGPDGKRRLTTIGDRGRGKNFLFAQEMDKFFLTYMINVAGWRPKKKS